jgi:hypothetical protein
MNHIEAVGPFPVKVPKHNISGLVIPSIELPLRTETDRIRS